MLILTALPVIDDHGNVDYVDVEVVYWIKPGQPSSSFTERIDDDLVIESVTDGAGTDYANVLTREQRRDILKKCDRELRDYHE